jgi:hypothetical protein
MVGYQLSMLQRVIFVFEPENVQGIRRVSELGG